MKVDILDDEIFNTLNPLEVSKYLDSYNWYELKRNDGEVSIWETSDKLGKKYRVWLPLDRDLGDFSISMGRLIKSVAIAENRSQLQLIEDLETVGIGDIIRTASQDMLNRTSSSLTYDDGVSLLNKSYNMAIAAACSTLEKKPVYSFRRPNRVVEYLKSLRLGQSERGSYVFKIISPLPTNEYRQLQMQFSSLPLVDNTPFERQVVINLVKSLGTLRRVTQETYKRGKFYFEAFEEVVQEGISANLCEAIAGGDEDDKRYRPVEVNISWSYIIKPPRENLPERVSFPVEFMPYLIRAAQKFREQNPEEISFRGYVTALRRPVEVSDPGAITVAGILFGKHRNVRMTLEESIYKTAIRAHENGFEVSVDGQLIRQGNFYVIDKPTNFHIVSEQNITF
jgi:hypothetical protein